MRLLTLRSFSLRPFTIHRLASFLLACCLAISATLTPLSRTTPTAHAQPSDAELRADVVGFLALFPQLRNLPPPTWFQPGSRATYSLISATLGGGTAGSGLAQYDVLAVDATAAVQVVTYIDNGAGQLIPAGVTPSIGLPGIGEYWMNPTVLVNAESVANANLSVTRRTRTVGNQTVNVVRFQSTTSGGATNVYEFSTSSGILVFSSIDVPDPQTGNRQQSQQTLLGFRQLTLPWTPNTAPNWVRPGVFMEYTGLRTTTLSGLPPQPASYAVRAQITSATPNWSILSTAEFFSGVATGNSSAISGVGQLYAPYWLPRAALNTNINEQVLIDRDTLTGIDTTVERDANGNIIIRQLAPAFQLAHLYNRDLGSLDASFLDVVTPTSRTVTDIGRSGGSDLVAINNLPELPDDTPPEQDDVSNRLHIPVLSR